MTKFATSNSTAKNFWNIQDMLEIVSKLAISYCWPDWEPAPSLPSPTPHQKVANRIHIYVTYSL